jgi:beta-glucosidase
MILADYLKYGDYVVNGSYLRGVTPYDGIKAASKGGLFERPP